MTDTLDGAVRSAIAGMTSGPKPLRKAIEFHAAQDGHEIADVDSAVAARIRGGANDAVRNALHSALAKWDWAQDPAWAPNTSKVSRERRERIYERLQVSISPVLKEAFEELEIYEGPEPIVIENPDDYAVWYTEEFRSKRSFYWKHLEDYYGEVRKMSPDAVAALGYSADRITSRLGDPASEVTRAARGLVVGYVQSGKTTNFTAVIAKAIDAGYRLIIVLSGTTNLLRNQTQRRLDMELAGYDNVLRKKAQDDEHDYRTDPDWPARFIRYPGLPSLLGSVDILRLTGREDFQSQGAGINPVDFEFEKRNRLKRLYERENLDHANARLVIVKKQKDRLQKLCRLLKDIGDAGSEIPALVIDDESDQASVNTIDPRKPRPAEQESRTKINGYLIKILKYLPRAQYIGYTATPFANCFVDPDDPADIYPSDFIVSLQRPRDYMGASAFHDFEAVPDGSMSNEKAHIRGIPGAASGDSARLAEAIDAFVLTAAIKSFRASKGSFRYDHHTMLIHESALNARQDATRDQVLKLWGKGGYDSPAAVTRLWSLLERDFLPVTDERGEGLRLPGSREELKQHLGLALARIRSDGQPPVMVVNSAETSKAPDFDNTKVWKIIVGGTKLSRGYTVEGLTVSYFRRRATTQDTLMQMGRWFGYRLGYRDLIRLYIGRQEPDGKRPPFDLYKAFEALCRDEEDFREQLKMYELGLDGRPGITPREIPALIFNSHPRLRPTSKNKMFNARLEWAAFTYREPTQQAMNKEARLHNERLFRDLLSSKSVDETEADVSWTPVRRKKGGAGKPGRTQRRQFIFKWRSASNEDVTRLLESLDWGPSGKAKDGKGYLGAEIEFLRRSPAPVDEWLLVVPQLGSDAGGRIWQAGKNSYVKVERSRLETRFGGFSSPEHVELAKWLVERSGSGATVVGKDLKPASTRGVMLVYPTVPWSDKKLLKDQTIMGFALVLPDVGRRMTFKVVQGTGAGGAGPIGPSARPSPRNAQPRRRTSRRRGASMRAGGRSGLT